MPTSRNGLAGPSMSTKKNSATDETGDRSRPRRPGRSRAGGTCARRTRVAAEDQRPQQDRALERGPQPGDGVQQRRAACVVLGDVADREVVADERPLHRPAATTAATRTTNTQRRPKRSRPRRACCSPATRTVMPTTQAPAPTASAAYPSAAFMPRRRSRRGLLRSVDLRWLYSAPCLIMMRSDSNGASGAVEPNDPRPRPARLLEQVGGSPLWSTTTVVLAVGDLEAHAPARLLDRAGTTAPARRNRSCRGLPVVRPPRRRSGSRRRSRTARPRARRWRRPRPRTRRSRRCIDLAVAARRRKRCVGGRRHRRHSTSTSRGTRFSARFVRRTIQSQ